MSVQIRQSELVNTVSSTKKTGDLEIRELKRAQLGRGVRGKYFQRFMHSSHVVVLRPNAKPTKR